MEPWQISREYQVLSKYEVAMVTEVKGHMIIGQMYIFVQFCVKNSS